MEKNGAVLTLYDELKKYFEETHHQGERYLSLVPAFNTYTDNNEYRFRSFAIKENDDVEFLNEEREARQPLYMIEWDIDEDALNEIGWDFYVNDFIWKEIGYAEEIGYYVLNTARGYSPEGEELDISSPYTPPDFKLPIL
ncbi:MAG: hypothetical protein ACOX4I_02750 [Anaerovoracaceae bacterium]|jgi:hypothetical protein